MYAFYLGSPKDRVAVRVIKEICRYLLARVFFLFSHLVQFKHYKLDYFSFFLIVIQRDMSRDKSVMAIEKWKSKLNVGRVFYSFVLIR